MSNLKREWNPCKVCKKYYEYTCNSDIKNCKNFILDNSFKNFLFTRNNYNLDKIYFLDKDIKLNTKDLYNKDIIDLRNNSFEKISEKLLYGLDFIHIFILSIDDETRDFIFNNDYIMSNYEINMVVDDNIKKSLKYRLDQRFSYITFDFFQKNTIL